MPFSREKETLGLVRNSLQRLTGEPSDYDSLLRHIGDVHFVLIGEASHGTHEFYGHRAEITKRLIREHGFHAVAAEADWPDAHRVIDTSRTGLQMAAPKGLLPASFVFQSGCGGTKRWLSSLTGFATTISVQVLRIRRDFMGSTSTV